jgi:type I restriction enzyme S subunit
VTTQADRWARLPLGDALETLIDYRGKTPAKLGGDWAPAGVPVISAMNIKGGKINFDRNRRFVDTALAAAWMKSPLRAGDLLMTSEAPLGELALVPDHRPLVLGQRLFALRGQEALLDNRFLALWLTSPDGRGQLQGRASGTTVTGIRQAELVQLQVPLPSLIEQRRLVDILEDHLSRLDAADNLLSSSELRSEHLSASWMNQQAAVSEAPRMPLGDLLAAPLRHGRSVPTANEGFPVLRLTALRSPSADLSARKIGAWSADEAAPFLVQPDDFLVARGSGSLHLVGRGALVEPPVTPVAFPDTAIRVRVQQDLLTTRFLSLIWNGPGVRRQIEAAAKTTAGIHKVNQGELLRIVLPVPPLDAQHQVITAATALTDQTLELGTALLKARVRSANLRRSLLASAFSGRL